MQAITREEFMWSALALAALPTRAADGGSGASVLPTGEKIKPKEITIVAGAAKPFTVLHVSDTHLTSVYPHEDKWKQEM